MITGLSADTLYRIRVISEVGTVISNPSLYALISTKRSSGVNLPLSTVIYMKGNDESDLSLKLEVN